MLEKTVVISRMNELAKFIGYEPNDITFLSKAMHCQRIHREGDGKNRKNYTNDSLATLGDSLLKFILTEYLFDNGYDNVKGVTVYKNFREPTSKVNRDELRGYKIVKPSWITFVQTTHNEKVFAYAFNNTNEDIVVSSVNEVFSTNATKLLPQYL